MIRFALFFLLIATTAIAQDSTFVNETCGLIQNLPDRKNTEEQAKIMDAQHAKHALSISRLPKDQQQAEATKFQYRLNRALRKTCPGFMIQRVPVKGMTVMDLESKFSKEEVDSLKRMIARIQKEKKMLIYIVTIDDYYPDQTIEYFCNRNRELWNNEYSFERGTVMMAYSFTHRELRISTGFKSMDYLTDDECRETVDFITTFFKRGDFFAGVAAGLYNLKEKI